METPPSVERPSLDAVLSIFFQKDRLGACVYRGRLTALETCESWEHGPLDPPSLSELCSSEHTSVSLIGESYLALQTLLRQVEPTLLLAPARSPESLISILHSYVEGQTCTELPRPCRLNLLPANYYSYERACNFISSIYLPDGSDIVTAKVAISRYVDLNEIHMVRACGALISYILEDSVPAAHAPSDMTESVVRRDRDVGQIQFQSASNFIVTSITTLELDGRLRLDSSVLEYLQIFHLDPHPSAFGGAPKEGISLFSLLDRCASKFGSKLLKHWLLSPLSDPSLIEQRLDTIDFLWSWLDEESYQRLYFHLKRNGDLRLALSRLNIGTSMCKDWIQLKELCIAAIRTREMLISATQSLSRTLPPLIQKIINFDDRVLLMLSQEIENSLELDPKKDKRPQIRGGVDAELDRLRSMLTDLDSFLDTVGQRELVKFPGITSLRVIYIPQIGFQLAVPQPEQLPLNHPEEPVLQFESNQYQYYRTNTTHELNDMLGDLSPLISDRTAAVLRSLSESTLLQSRQLLACSQLMAELDVITAMMRVSRENNFVRPTIRNPIDAFSSQTYRNLSSNNTLASPSRGDFSIGANRQRDSAHSDVILDAGAIHILGGRHPLLEHVMASATQRYVSNSTNVSLSSPYVDKPSLHFILGPNGSGKSVYLTQTGLIVFMAHIGCFVPAEEATISVVDQIFTFSSSGVIQPANPKSNASVGTLVGSGAGSFAMEVQQMAKILKHATPLSFVVIDEFGRGTTESDATALLLAFVEKLTSPRPLRTVDAFGRDLDSEGTPKTLISTHLKILHSPTLQKMRSKVSFFHMNVIVREPPSTRVANKVQGSPANQLTPTYLYQLTPVSESFQPLQLGLFCAKISGIPASILERANIIRNNISRNEPIQPISVTHSNQDSAEAQDDKRIDTILESLERNFGEKSLHSMSTVDALTFLRTVDLDSLA